MKAEGACGQLTRRAGPRVLLGASDERLVALARAGDEQAFAAIVERYRAPLLRYCHGYLTPAAAEDALQQTFINAYAALVRGRGSAPVALRPWLYRIAHNAALNVARDPQAGLEALPEGLDGVRRPDEIVQQRERLRRVVRVVAALPPKQRQVIVRQAFEGDSHERIATDLGMSVGSIRQLAHRARRTIRDAAAALLPTPILRMLPLGSEAIEVAPAAGGGAALVKVAVAAMVASAAGGGAVELAQHEATPRAVKVAHTDALRSRARVPSRAVPGLAASGEGTSRPGSPKRGDDAAPRSRTGAPRTATRGDSSGSGSGGGSSGSGSSGRGSSGSGSSGSGSSGSGSSGSGSSGSGSESSGSGSSGSGSSGSGSSGSGSSGSGSSGTGSSGSGSSGSSSGSSGSGSSGSGSSGSGSSTSGPSGGDSGSGSSGSGSSGSGSLSSGSGSGTEPSTSGSDSGGSSGRDGGSGD